MWSNRYIIIFKIIIIIITFVINKFLFCIKLIIGCLVGTPGDILKIRLINDLNSTKYSGIVDCWQQAIKDNGYRSMLKGLDINIIRAIVVNACELATYDQAKDYFVNSL